MKYFRRMKLPLRVLLETTAGQGSSVGHRFEHIRDIIAVRADILTGSEYALIHAISLLQDMISRQKRDT